MSLDFIPAPPLKWSLFGWICSPSDSCHLHHGYTCYEPEPIFTYFRGALFTHLNRCADQAFYGNKSGTQVFLRVDNGGFSYIRLSRVNELLLHVGSLDLWIRSLIDFINYTCFSLHPHGLSISSSPWKMCHFISIFLQQIKDTSIRQDPKKPINLIYFYFKMWAP